MKDSDRRRYEMFLRVREFGAAHTAQFPPATLGNELLARLNTIVTELDSHTSAQSSGKRAAQQGAGSKASARAELREDLERISRTARAMALTMPGLEDKFRAPRSISDQALLAVARSFAADALPLKPEFTRRGLPANFLDDLEADISDFETSINEKIQGTEKQVTATAAIDDAIERGLNTVRELDAIIRNTFADDAATLAAWLSASRAERAPKRTKQPVQPTA
jgi:hypothetical protein